MTTSPRPAPRANVDIVVGLFSLFSDNLNIVRSWGFYLFSPEFENELALRNRVGVVWLTSLLDSLEGEMRSLENYRNIAGDRGLPHLIEVCDQVAAFMECIKEISQRYSRAEQLFLSDMRDQLVHSWLARRHASEFQIKYFDGQNIVKDRLSPKEHSDIVRPFYLQGDLDQTLHGLLIRFRDLNLRYWHVINELAQNPDLDRVQDAMLAGKTFRIEALTRAITGPVEFRFG